MVLATILMGYGLTAGAFDMHLHLVPPNSSTVFSALRIFAISGRNVKLFLVVLIQGLAPVVINAVSHIFLAG